MQQAGISGAIDPLVQKANIEAGVQSEYDPWRTYKTAAVGAVIGGGLRAGGDAVGGHLGATPEGPPKPQVSTPELKIEEPANVQASISRALVPWDGPVTLDRLTRRTPDQILAAAQTTERGKWGFSLFGDSVVQYFDKKDATLGRLGSMQYHMPLEDSVAIRNVANAYKETGAAGTIAEAYKGGGKVFGVVFPLEGRRVRPPARSDAGISEHYLEGGITAVALPEHSGFMVNETREFVSPGGDKMPYGSILVNIENGKRIVKRTWP